MSKSITQDMAYRQSLMTYAEKYGVSRASRKYNKSRSYIYFWKSRWDGTVQSLACRSRRPHSHPNQHTEAELKLIRDMRRRNPDLGMMELWHRLRKRGYTRRPESLFRVMRKLGLLPSTEKKKTYKPKPYEQMTYPGQRVQVDVKVVPRRCITDPELRLFQYTAIDEFTRLRFLAAYSEQSTYSSADFLKRLFKWYARRGIRVECVQTDNGFEFTNRFSNSRRDLPTLFEATAATLGIRHKLIRPYTPFIGVVLLLTGCMLFVSDRMTPGKKTERNMRFRDALIIGLCQCVATIPGLSRSGTTITAGIATGLDRKFAMKYSFLLSLPAVLGANLLSLIKALTEESIDASLIPAYLIGMLFAMLSGIAAILLMKLIARKSKFGWFAYYCWGAGALTIILSLIF